MVLVETLALRWGWIPLLLIYLITVGSYELAIHFPIHKHHDSHLSVTLFPHAIDLSIERTFPGFTMYEPSDLENLNLPENPNRTYTKDPLRRYCARIRWAYL